MLILSPVNVELYIVMFKIYRVHFNTPNSLTVKHHSKPQGLYDEFFIVPIHMALVSEIFIFKPEYFSNMLRLSNSSFAETIGSLSKHDDDGNKNLTNLHI